MDTRNLTNDASREAEREAKEELLTLLLEEEGFDVLQSSAIPPRETGGHSPLSFAQQRLWFLDQLQPGSSAYNIPTTIRLVGSLDVTALEQSLNEIVRRHEALRTTISTVDGQPVQVIAPALNLTLPVIDLRRFPKMEREVEVQRLATEAARRPFDLEQGPLLRITLLRLNEVEHVLLLTIHHIVSDDWSMDVFARELAALYGAFSTGSPSPLPEPAIQYADFAAWQRQWLRGEVLETQLSYWKRQLGGSLPVLELPADRPRPAIQTFQGASQSLTLSRALTEALNALSQRQGATLFMNLLAAFKTLLYRYTEQQDIIVGTPIAGRNRAETEELIGLFLNTLALRTDLSGNPSFRELLDRVRQVALRAYTHQDLPFERLVEELQPERSLTRHPIFDVMFNFINTPKTTLRQRSGQPLRQRSGQPLRQRSGQALELPGLTITSQELVETEAKFSMTLYAEEQESGLSLRLVYQQALFSAERMACFLAQFQYMLEQIAAAPDSSIQSYSLVTPESRSLLPDPRAVLPEPRHEAFTTRFAAWADRSPGQPAVCQGDHVWSYAELAESAYALARLLLARGVRRGEVIAVSGPRSFGLITSMLSVFLSGGVLLTLDQNLPRHRRQLMIQETGASRLLYVGVRRPEDGWMWEFPGLSAKRRSEQDLLIIRVDADTGHAIAPGTDSERAASEDVHLKTIPLPELAPDEAAYILFTSGTTGVPKGILGCHKGLSHFLDWQRQTFAIGPQDRSAQLTGLSFDVVLRDIFLPLTSGATLCLPVGGDDLGSDRVLPWLEREQITILHTVPALAQSWLVNVPPGVSLRTLRWVFFAGEPLTETLVRRWREAFPEAGEIVNLYGPAETTLAKCCYRVPPDIPPGVQPIGFPLPETQALVLTKDNQLCGIGEPGEIVLRTRFQSLGYINAPEENQQRFIKNPFRSDEQDLLYYTGDRGRYRPDGSLDILGRTDHQIKIRGMRIEPEEIEITLCRHPAVWETVIVAREDHPGDRRLAAYVVPIPGQTPTTGELRRFLKEKLPDYMVPSAFVMLDALPLTPNGKIDRSALPTPDTSRSDREAGKDLVAPRAPVEESLTAIWANILGLEQVGVHDNFFELGGHSLLATQVISRLRETFQVELPLRSLFEEPTVAGLAKRIEAIRWAAQDWLAPSDATVMGDDREEGEL